jgi:heat shock protein HtpX
LENLTNRELEAVAGHELSHIINKDSLLSLVIVVFVSIFSLIGDSFLNWGGPKQKNHSISDAVDPDEVATALGGIVFTIVGIFFTILGYLVYPFTKFAISKKREYLADLGSIQLTKDIDAMISALQKIEGHSAVPNANKDMALFFIDSPVPTIQEITHKWHKPLEKKPSHVLDSHPSIQERISALMKY